MVAVADLVADNRIADSADLDQKAIATAKTDTLTAQEFANLVNLDKRRVQQLAKEGVIEKEGRGRYPLGEITAYIRYLQELVQRRKIDPELPEGALNPEQERARKDKELADKTELENRVRRGEVVEAAEIDAAWADIALAIRSKLLGMGAKLAPTLAGESKAAAVKQAIDTAVRQVLKELSEHGDDEKQADH